MYGVAVESQVCEDHRWLSSYQLVSHRNELFEGNLLEIKLHKGRITVEYIQVLNMDPNKLIPTKKAM